jgi:putative transposase
MSNLPYGPKGVRRVSLSRLPKGIRNSAVSMIERKQQSGTVTDLVTISDGDWREACRRFNAIQGLAERHGKLGGRVKEIAKMFGATDRTVRRWLSVYRSNPDIVALLPRPKGPRLGNRRLKPDSEQILTEVVDAWAARAERLPVSWIVEECRRRARPRRIDPPGRRAIESRLRDRGLDGLLQKRFAERADPAITLTPRTRQALAIVQIDHTLVDIMVVDEVLRESMGRPWVTVVIDIATRVVLGFALRLDPPSATSVGLALTMACLPKSEWLKERQLDFEWAPAGVPKLIHMDNAKEFHSLALRRGCERYGISIEYRPPGRPQYGGHIERYLGTLMKRIHGLPGTTYSNPSEKGNYRSEARATMTMAELERWMALEIGGRYHQRVHRGVHAVPAQLWAKAVHRKPPPPVADPARFIIDFLPADTRRVGRNGFQINRIRYWNPILSRVFPPSARVLVRHDPRDLSRVFVPSPGNSDYLAIPYADLRRPPITLVELERARTLLSAKGNTQPTEDLIFATTEAQRRLEQDSAKRSRRARRNLARRPQRAKVPAKPRQDSAVNYNERIVPYSGEIW